MSGRIATNAGMFDTVRISEISAAIAGMIGAKIDDPNLAIIRNIHIPAPPGKSEVSTVETLETDPVDGEVFEYQNLVLKADEFAAAKTGLGLALDTLQGALNNLGALNYVDVVAKAEEFKLCHVPFDRIGGESYDRQRWRPGMFSAQEFDAAISSWKLALLALSFDPGNVEPAEYPLPLNFVFPDPGYEAGVTHLGHHVTVDRQWDAVTSYSRGMLVFDYIADVWTNIQNYVDQEFAQTADRFIRLTSGVTTPNFRALFHDFKPGTQTLRRGA